MESAAKKMKVEGGAAIIGQSGGPTVVINRSLVGWITAAKKEGKITKVLGMRHGIKGLLAEHIVDLGAETEENLANVAATPAAALGSVRMKPTKEDFAAMIPVLQKFNIKYFFYIGGNDSAETAHIVNESAKEQGYDMKCFHIPKTIDNDLRVTDHCPGYASAARFVAHGFQGDDRDLRAMGGCKINICMGRDAVSSLSAALPSAAASLAAHTLAGAHTWPGARAGLQRLPPLAGARAAMTARTSSTSLRPTSTQMSLSPLSTPA